MTALQRPTSNRRSAEPARPRTPRPPLRVVEQRPVPQRPDRRRLAVLAGGLLFATVLAGNVAVQAQTTQGQFELERLQKAGRERQARYQQLRLEVAQLEAPQRVVGRARQMGMIEPARVTYLTPTTKTSATAPNRRDGDEPVPTGEAAGGWEHVKPHLDGGR
jgi:cell division protein FtsL